HLRDDVFEGRRGLLVRAGDAHDIGAGPLQRLDLSYRRLDIMRQRVGHRLDGDRRVAADRYRADMDLPTLPSLDVAIRTHAHGKHLGKSRRWEKSRGWRIKRLYSAFQRRAKPWGGCVSGAIRCRGTR